MSGSPAVVLLSGGMDSATVLAMAIRDGHACHALSFAYGQRHSAELESAKVIADRLGAASHRLVSLDIGAFGGSALTDPAIAVPEEGTTGIPVTYVPARNTVFLACALAWAETLGATDIFIGVNAIDYSGYPDCRPAFIEAFETLANLGTKLGVEGAHYRINAPLMSMGKGDIVRAGVALGVDHSLTVSCYQATVDGRACGRCDACRLRREGFRAAGIADPTRYA